MMASLLNKEKKFLEVSCQTDLTMEDLNSIMNTPDIMKFKTPFHRQYFYRIKKELGSLLSDEEIDNRRLYYYKYMEPYYSDKIIHIYSSGKIGNGYNKMCVYCQKEGHVQSTCPKALSEGLHFTHNF